MRIINQRHDMSLNYNQISIFVEDANVYAMLDGKMRILGRYANEERAKEVFMEIHTKQKDPTHSYVLGGKPLDIVYIMPDE